MSAIAFLPARADKVVMGEGFFKASYISKFSVAVAKTIKLSEIGLTKCSFFHLLLWHASDKMFYPVI